MSKELVNIPNEDYNEILLRAVAVIEQSRAYAASKFSLCV